MKRLPAQKSLLSHCKTAAGETEFALELVASAKKRKAFHRHHGEVY